MNKAVVLDYKSSLQRKKSQPQTKNSGTTAYNNYQRGGLLTTREAHDQTGGTIPKTTQALPNTDHPSTADSGETTQMGLVQTKLTTGGKTTMTIVRVREALRLYLLLISLTALHTVKYA